jgi:hypothetical protein
MPNVILLASNDFCQHKFNVFGRPVTAYGKLGDARLTVILQVPSFATLLWERLYEMSAVKLFVSAVTQTVCQSCYSNCLSVLLLKLSVSAFTQTICQCCYSNCLSALLLKLSVSAVTQTICQRCYSNCLSVLLLKLSSAVPQPLHHRVPQQEWVPGIFTGCKGSRCEELTTLPPSCADCLKIWEPQPAGTLRACQGLQWDCFTFTFT